MMQIWREQIVKLGVIDRGNLYANIHVLLFHTANKITEVQLSWSILEYGVYQDRGTGKETPRGNPGDIGRAKVREARPWLSKKFYSSFMRIRDFFADNLGREYCATLPRIMEKSIV